MSGRERLVRRTADLDVHKDVIVAEARLRGGEIEQGQFATTKPELLELRDWLVALWATEVSTGIRLGNCVQQCSNSVARPPAMSCPHVPGRAQPWATAAYAR